MIAQVADAQEQITGPWLWMIAPTEPGRGGAESIDVDSLAAASDGAITEAEVARNGATAGETVGNYAWTLGEISPTGLNNVNECINRISLSPNADINDHSSYALISLQSTTNQFGAIIHVGSDDAIKVWFNGEVVHKNAINRGALKYQDEFRVNLQKGENLLMVKVSERETDWGMFVGIIANLTDDPQPDSRPEQMVQLIYLLPTDRQPQQNIDATLDGMIKEAQQFYADQMQKHGFGRKTFRLESDRNGNAVVHHINGEFTEAYYQQDTGTKVWTEVEKHFDSSNVYIVFIDVGAEHLGTVTGGLICGFAIDFGLTGLVTIPASGLCLNVRTIIHELGHTFGLAHDNRSDTYLMSHGPNSDRLSACAAEWLDVHRHFNTYPVRVNRPTEIEMLRSPSKPPNPIRLRFRVRDPDGLHQFQLLSPDNTEDLKLLGCKPLNGENETIEFIISELERKPGPHLRVRVMDAWGNHVEQEFPNYSDL